MYWFDSKARQGFLLQAIKIQLIFRIPGVHTGSAELHSDTAAADSSGLIPGTWAAHTSFPRQLEPPCALQSTCTLRAAEEKLGVHAGSFCLRQQLLKTIYSDST